MKIIILEIILLETNMFNINHDCFDAASPEINWLFYFKIHGSDLLENCLCEKQVMSQEATGCGIGTKEWIQHGGWQGYHTPHWSCIN